MSDLVDENYGLEALATSNESFALQVGKLVGLITVEEHDKWVTITNVRTQNLAKDLLKYFHTSVLIKHMFKQVTYSKLVVHKFFLIDLEYMLRVLEKQPNTNLGKRTYIKIREELKLKTWLGRLTANTPSIFNLDKLKDIKFSLLKHQEEFISYYDKILPRYGLKGILLAADPGLGKTITAVAVASCYEAENIIVVSPKNAVYRVWEATLRDSMTTKETWWVAADGTPMPSSDKCRWFIFHYEALEKALALRDSIKNKKCVVILDESHNFNEMKSLRTSRFVELCNTMNNSIVVELSGTPMKALGFEAIPLIKAIDPLFDDYCMEAFKKIYGKNAVKATEILANRLGIIMYKVTRDESTVQQPVEHTVYVKVPDSDRFLLSTIKEEMMKFINERMAYYKERKEFFSKVYWDAIHYFESKYFPNGIASDEHRTYLSYINEFIKFGYDPVNSGPKAVYCNKYEKEVIDPVLKPEMRHGFRNAKSVVKYVDLKIRGECLGTVLSRARTECNLAIVQALDFSTIIDNAEKKTLVFTSYVDVVKATEERLKELGYMPTVVYAETNNMLPQIVKKFGEDENINPLVATYQSLSTAVPLIMANTVILLNAPFRIHEKEQTVARANRLGQDKTVQVYNVFLDTKGEPNISTRSLDIMEWSKEQVNALMGFSNDIDVGIESVVLECLEHEANTTVTLESYYKASIKEYEKECGFKWTKELSEHFNRINPTSRSRLADEYITLSNLQTSFELWKELVYEAQYSDDSYESVDGNKTRAVYWDKGWIPLEHMDGRTFYYDLNPDAKGKVGQIGKWYHDDNERRVGASSLKDLEIEYNDGVNPIKSIKEVETKHGVKVPSDVVTWYTQEVMECWYMIKNGSGLPLPVFAIETTDFEINGVLSIAMFEYTDGNYISYVLKGNEKYSAGVMIGVSSTGDTIYGVAADSLKDFKQGKFKTKLHTLFTEERPDTSNDKPSKPWWKFWG